MSDKKRNGSDLLWILIWAGLAIYLYSLAGK